MHPPEGDSPTSRGGDARAREDVQGSAHHDLPLVDALRLFASVAVVYHHLRGGFFFGTPFGVPLFLVIMLALSSRASRREGYGEFARRKAEGLLVPWLRWSLVYVMLAIVLGIARESDPTAGLEPRMLFYGGHGALWFLPFSMLALLVVRGAREAWSHGSRGWERGPWALTMILAVLGGLCSWAAQRWVDGLALGMPFEAWWIASPAIFFGPAVARASLAPSSRERAVQLALIALCAVVPSLLAPPAGALQDATRRFALAVPIVCLGFGWGTRVPDLVRVLATLTFGVYLAHPLVAKALATAFDVFAWSSAVHLACVWGISALIVLALRRAPIPLAECWSGRWRHEPGVPVPHAVKPRRAA